MTPHSDLIVVRTFSQPHEAHVARSALHAAGIHATLADDHIVSANWMYSNAVGGVKVLVPAEDAAEAELVLATPAESDARAIVAETGTSEDDTTCPRCGSANRATVTPGRRLAFLSWLLVGFPVPVFRRIRCGDCGYSGRVE